MLNKINENENKENNSQNDNKSKSEEMNMKEVIIEGVKEVFNN